MNIVRKTKGIKLPTIEWLPYGEAQKKVSSAKLTFSCCYSVLDETETVCNTICKQYYNCKTPKNQD